MLFIASFLRQTINGEPTGWSRCFSIEEGRGSTEQNAG